jgi:predicted RNase H-like nuclease
LETITAVRSNRVVERKRPELRALAPVGAPVAEDSPVRVVGIDACRAKWLAVVLSDGRFEDARLRSDVRAHLDDWSDAAAIGIDIPISLPAVPWRDADRAAREFVGERRSSVFATFPEAVLLAPTYEDAKAICVANGWPRPSLQSYGMRHRILEVARAAADPRVFEVHPEVSFRELHGRTLSSKRSAAGLAERRLVLAGAGIQFQTWRTRSTISWTQRLLAGRPGVTHEDWLCRCLRDGRNGSGRFGGDAECPLTLCWNDSDAVRGRGAGCSAGLGVRGSMF